jgi:ribosomal protein S18 acetylase RimI-like enzyme
VSAAPFSISIDPSASLADVDVVRRGLIEFNARHLPDDNYEPLTVLVRDGDHRVVGGLLGSFYWGVVAVDIVWLADNIQGQGIGAQMMQLVEEEACRRGASCIHLDTMSFQARGFYEKLGYQVYGELTGYPNGVSRSYMVKQLAPSSVGGADR